METILQKAKTGYGKVKLVKVRNERSEYYRVFISYNSVFPFALWELHLSTTDAEKAHTSYNNLLALELKEESAL